MTRNKVGHPEFHSSVTVDGGVAGLTGLILLVSACSALSTKPKSVTRNDGGRAFHACVQGCTKEFSFSISCRRFKETKLLLHNFCDKENCTDCKIILNQK